MHKLQVTNAIWRSGSECDIIIDGLFILDVNIKYIVFSILYRYINVPMVCKVIPLLKQYRT